MASLYKAWFWRAFLVVQLILLTMNSHQAQWQEAPWLSFSALAISLACTIACTIIITVSNGQPDEAWKIKPSVFVATLFSVSTVSQGFAFSGALAIFWWRTAMRGTTLERLHYIWNHGNWLRWRKIPSLRSVGSGAWVIIGLSVGVATCSLVSHPLFQQATRTKIVFTEESTFLAMEIASTIPDGWDGVISYDNPVNITVYGHFSYVAQDWYFNRTITTSKNKTASKYFCDGICEATIRAPGLRSSCSQTVEIHQITQTDNSSLYIFNLDFMRANNATGFPTIQFLATYSPMVTKSCLTTIVKDKCELQLATLDYHVFIRDNAVTFDSGKSANVVEILSSAGDSSDAPALTPSGPLASLVHVASGFFSSYARVLILPFSHGIGREAHGIASEYFYDYQGLTESSLSSGCMWKWTSPTEYVISVLREIAFRAAAMAGRNNETKEFPVVQRQQTLVFESKFGAMAGAVVVQLLALIAIALLFHGWSDLGREVSLSPLEVAKAFQAPLFQGASQGHNIDAILDDAGSSPVKYNKTHSAFESLARDYTHPPNASVDSGNVPFLLHSRQGQSLEGESFRSNEADNGNLEVESALRL